MTGFRARPAVQFRDQLRSSVAASAAPYGYTLTVWGTGAVSVEELGAPGLGGALLFLSGAVLAFVITEAAAYGSLRVTPMRGETPTVSILGNAHWAAAGVPILAAWALDKLIAGLAAWPVVGFVATTGYLTLNALQTALASQAAD